MRGCEGMMLRAQSQNKDEKALYMAENAANQQAMGLLNTPVKQVSDSMSFADLLGILRKHLITLVVTFAVVFGVTVLYTAMSPVKYTANTQLFASYDSSNESTSSAEQYNGSSYIMNQIQSYPDLAKTSAVLQPVIDELHLSVNAKQLASQVSVTNPSNTVFVNISVTDQDPSAAARIADSVANSLSEVIEKSLYSNGAHSSVKLSIVEPAAVPSSPSSPKWTFNILAGIAGGLIIGILAALLKNVLSKKIHDEDEVTDIINAPVIGRVVKDDVLAGTSPAVVCEPGSPIAEDFRRIRTNLSFSTPVDGTDCRLVVVTSAGASEGKTTVTVNIAAALAEDGARVLLIDADLRHPSVAHKLAIDGSAGLTHVLSGQASVKDVIQRYWKPNLHIMPAGPKPPNASALLNSPMMSTLLENAIRQYDYVLIDTAPMVVANDAVIFMRQGGALVMVCRREQTIKHDLRVIGEELNTLDMDVSGIVFNCAKENKKALENSNYYYYYNSSASNDSKKPRKRKK